MEEKKKRFRPTLTAYRALESERDALKSKLLLTEKSNDYLSDTNHRLRVANAELTEKNKELQNTIDLAEKRGFWARIFGK